MAETLTHEVTQTRTLLRDLTPGDRILTWKDHRVVSFTESAIVTQVERQGRAVFVTFNDGDILSGDYQFSSTDKITHKVA